MGVREIGDPGEGGGTKVCVCVLSVHTVDVEYTQLLAFHCDYSFHDKSCSYTAVLTKYFPTWKNMFIQ